MSSPEKQIYRFANVEVNASQNCLTRGDEEQHLRRKAFHVLVHLLERRERLVTKEELIETIWKDTAVTDDALVQCIKEIRRVIGDDSHQPRFIKTIPKSGYRFIGTLEKQYDGSDAKDAGFVSVSSSFSAAPAGENVSSPFSISTFFYQRKVLTAILISVAVFFSLSFLSRSFWQREQQNTSAIVLPQTAGKKSLAVMYFENQSRRAELEWLSEGVADMLITNLSRSPKINVLSRWQFHTLAERNGIQKGDKISFPQAVGIAQKSQATNFITGSFAKAGDKIRLDVQLYDAQTGALVVAESLVADKPEQILTDMDLLSLKLIKHLGIGEQEFKQTTIAQVMTDNLEAYRFYSLGVEKTQALQNKEAIELLEKAVALDPQFAMAHARIGYAYSITWGHTEKGKPHLEKAFKLSDRLTEKDRLNINAWYAIANLDFPGAIRAFREIINKYPTDTESYRRLGRLLTGEEQFDEAIQVLRQGLTIDPEDKNIHNALGGTLSLLGRHDEAIAAHQRYVALAPAEPNAYDSLGASYQWAGDYQSAIANYNRALELDPNFEIALVHLANNRAWLGQYDEAINLYRRYIEIAPSDSERARGFDCIAQVYLKKRDFTSAEKAVKEVLKYKKDAVWQSFFVASESGDAARAGRLEKLVFAQMLNGSDRGARANQRFELYLRGYIALRKGQEQEAIANFKETVKRKPPSWNIEPLEDCLANAYLQLGRFDEAIAEYERIIQLNPNYPLAHFHLAQALERKGQITEARENYRLFLDAWKNADADIPEVVTAKDFIGNL
jgi:tetratricopeptide (TPR) repeat protein/DNA-binding winged helix-turn-helix (wHTH) protein